MRDAAINLRAHPEQRDLIDQAAMLLNKNRSDFMLEAACDKAQAVLLDQVFFKLDDAKFQELKPPFSLTRDLLACWLSKRLGKRAHESEPSRSADPRSPRQFVFLWRNCFR